MGPATETSEPTPTPGWLRSKWEAWTRLRPAFLIIGAQRGGTTSLYRYLCEHPLILPAHRKEVHFFDHHWKNGPEWYGSQFPSRFAKAEGKGAWFQRISGEASPSYMLHPLAAERAFSLAPHAKLIAILRNPVDRAFSQYHQVRRRDREPLSFEEALDKETSRIQGERERLIAGEIDRSDPLQWYSLCTRGHYEEQLQVWAKRFGRKNLHVVISEDLYADPIQVLNPICTFLGLPSFPKKAAEEFRKFNHAEYEEMNPDTRARLIEYFRPHNARLAEFLGRNPGWDV